MLAAFRSRLTFANVVSLMALFVALSGGAYALTVPKNSVGAKALKKNAVTEPKIKKNAVTSPKVRNGTLTGTDVRSDSLTGADLDEDTIGRVPSASTANSANTATSANTASNANALGGEAPNAFQTESASDARSDVAAPQGTLSPALSATITTSAPRTLTAIASVEASADGGADEDNINCSIQIDGVNGGSQSTYITPQPAFADSTVVPLTMARAVGAGTHTVLVQCGDGIGSNTMLEDRFLTVVATG
jgi:hypothetical protein